MICRTWHGWTTRENADAYQHVVSTEVIPGIVAMKITGFRGAHLLRRQRLTGRGPVYACLAC
jgi:hypothetical protein